MTGNVQLYLPDGNRKAVPTPDGRAHSAGGGMGQGLGSACFRRLSGPRHYRPANGEATPLQ